MSAAADYQRHYRRTHPEYRAREKAVSRLRSRALTQLSHEYPARFLEIFEALKAIDATNPEEKK